MESQNLQNQCISAVQSLNIKDVIDFCWCPKYYDLKKNDPNEYNLKEAYDIALHKCFYSYLIALQQDDIQNGIEVLKRRWGKEWVKQKKNSQIICTPSAVKRDTYDAKRKAGIDAIITFEDIMSQDSQYPIIINKSYSLKIGNVNLTGVWEYVREVEINGENIIQIMKFKTENNRFQIVHQMNHDLELTAAALAFKETFNATKFQLLYVDIYKKKVITSYRTENDFKLLKETVNSVAMSIKHNIKCISPDKRCYHCEYRNVCSQQL